MNDKDQKSNGFVKLIRGPETEFLMNKYPKAFFLLTIIAYSARRYDGDPDGLKAGEAFIGDWESYDMSERNYRTAKQILINTRRLEIVETNRTRKKSTTGTTTRGTKVKLISSDVYDINIIVDDDRADDRPTTDRRLTDDERRTNKNIKNEKNEKETIKEKSDIARPSIRSLEASLLSNEELEGLTAYSDLQKWEISQEDLYKWLTLYGIDSIKMAFSKLIKNKTPLKTTATRWLQAALHRDYAKQDELIAENASFAFEFKNKNNWQSLTLTKAYCRDEDTGNDYQFKNQNFKQMLTEKFRQKQESQIA
jgi:hypothetical protein